jgi:hypothetical protein
VLAFCLRAAPSKGSNLCTGGQGECDLSVGALFDCLKILFSDYGGGVGGATLFFREQVLALAFPELLHQVY